MTRTALAASSLVLASLLAPPAEAQQGLRWRSGEVLAPSPVRQRRSAAELLTRAAAGGDRHVLVRLERAPDAHQRALWRAAGLELGRALGAGAWFARLRADALDPALLERLGGVVDVHELRPEWKLGPLLAAGETPAWTVVAHDAGGEATVAVYVLLQDDVPFERGERVLAGLGGSLFDVLDTVHGLVAFVPRSRVGELAADDSVAWVEAALPLLDEVALPRDPAGPAPNDSNRPRVQADLLQAAPYSLDGSGVNVLVYDAGTARASHLDFGGRLSVRDASGQIDHATHVCATIGGSGAASGGTWAGMAPGVTIQSYGFQYDGTGVFFFTNPGDFEQDYDEALNVHGVTLANNSIGSNVEPNGFHCPIQGDYGVLGGMIDAVVRGSLGSPLRIVWANGNERQGVRCDVEGFPGYYSTAPPATAKNHITVGALNSNDDSMTGFSSWGPTDDGRLKPDISAPGCQSDGDGGVTSAGASSDSAYVTYCGTSMASPTTCGVLALVIQDFRAHFGGPDPLNSTLKAFLAHTALDLGNVGPDYLYGYGRIRGKDAVDFMRLGRWLEDTLDETGEAVRWTVSVAPATPELRLTLAWDDAPGQPNVFGSLVNDLELIVLDPLGGRHHVWTLDPGNPAAPAVRNQPDHVNNIEQVLVDTPMAGTWSIEVRAQDLPVGPQGFSLASSHDLVDVPHVRISFPGGLPVVLEPGVATQVTAHVVGVDDALVGSPVLHARFDGGGFLAFAMSPLGGDLWQAELPPAVCDAAPEFYFSAEGALSGPTTQPAEAPLAVHLAAVASQSAVFADDFSADLGWSVSNVNLADGPWDRGTPAGGGTRGDPLTAWGGSGQCYLTDNLAGNSDVDGGPTRLVSPLLDLAASGEYEISYVRWFTNDDYDIDTFTVEVSNDDGADWVQVENVSAGGSGGGWVERSFRLGDFVARSAQVRVRFSVTDDPNDSVTEGGLDEFRVVRMACGALPDCNRNGILDADDIASGRSLDLDMNGMPDECVVVPPRKLGNPGAPGSVPARPAF